MLFFLKLVLSETDEEHSKIPIELLMKTRNVAHPCALYKQEDIERAIRNSEFSSFARARNESLLNEAEIYYRSFNDNFVENMVPRTTPCTHSFCPNCQKLHKVFSPDGDWKWSRHDPDHVKCRLCGMVFPNDEYPEVIQIRSQWDPEQVITYVNNTLYKCMSGALCRSSINGVIRARKLSHFITVIHCLAMGYPMKKDPKYAIAVKKGLLKLAERVPKYLLHIGNSYAEYCDEDPHEAVKHPKKCRHFIYPPGHQKDINEGMIYGYWFSTRLCNTGMGGTELKKLAIAYDLTADAKDENGNNIYSQEEKDFICKNCLIEAALLFFYDPSINNLAITNRKGVALVGLVTGNPVLTRYGLDGFNRALNEYFLPDGGVPESSAYGRQVFIGLSDFGPAFRNYSDPVDFVPPVGESKYLQYNVNTDSKLDEVFQSFLWTTYSDYYFPPLGDSDVNTKFDTFLVDLLSFLKQTKTIKTYVQEMYSKITVPRIEGFYYRDYTETIPIGTTNKTYEFPDVVFPYLSRGYIRSGYQGRDSLLILDASDYRNHHHRDSLNINYWKDGRELLNDMGYIRNTKTGPQAYLTKTHHTVLVNGKDQVTVGRNGSFNMFYTNDNVKIMKASSNAYLESSVYQRTVTQINHKSSNKSYIVDIFRANGGYRREYVFHGPTNNYTVNQNLKYEHRYTGKQFKGCIRFLIAGQNYFDISNVILRPILYGDTMGPNMAKPPEMGTFSDKWRTCPKDGVWCNYVGAGVPDLRVENNGPNGERSIHLGYKEPSFDGNYIYALNLGNSNGFTGENAFNLDANKEYYLEFDIKCSVMPRIHVQYWPNGEEMDPSKRKYSNNVFLNTDTPGNTNIWKKFRGKISIEQLSTALGAEFEDELDIKWDVDENYTFSSFTPKRVVNGTAMKQLVFYEDGFGQRNDQLSEYGKTLPCFMFCREQDELSTFVNVYEGSYRGESIVNSVSMNEFSNGSVAIEINTKEGNDYVLSSFDGSEINSFGIKTNAEIAVQIGEDLESTPMMINGEYYETNSIKFKGDRTFEGDTIKSFNEDENSWFEIYNENINLSHHNFEGSSIITCGESSINSNLERAYPIRKVESIGDNKYRVYTRVGSEGFRTHVHNTWKIPCVSTMIKQTEDEESTENVDISTENVEESTKETEKAEEQELSNTGKNNTVIIGASVGILVLIIIVAVVLFVVIRNKRKAEKEEDNVENLAILV